MNKVGCWGCSAILEKVILIFVAFSIIFGTTIASHAETNQIGQKSHESENTFQIMTKDERVVHDEFERLYNSVRDYSNNTKANNLSDDKNIIALRNKTVSRLKNKGIESYGIGEENYSIASDILKTDLRDIGVYEEGNYVVAIGGESTGVLSGAKKAKAGTSFEYTYNGKKYKLRYLTVTSADNSSYAKASDCDLLSSKVEGVIKKCLEQAIIVYISKFSKKLGTVASITGLGLSNIGTTKSFTLRLNGASNWTRLYTQVWDVKHKTWVSGSCVEYVQVLSHMSGSYYNKTKNRMESVPQRKERYTKYSTKYNDSNWRKKNGVIGYIHSYVNYDVTGNISFYYGGKKKLTHKENF